MVACKSETHHILKIFGIKIKFPKREFLKKQNNPYHFYKKNNVNIESLPPATGQIRDIQLANLELLKELDYVCKKNNLQYWLDFGSLLGACRHKGFIPWDDDIDTGMLRGDYNKIIDAFKKDSRNSDIYAEIFADRKNDCMIKVLHKKCPHLFVDIFPYDIAPELSEKEQLRLSKFFSNYHKKVLRKIPSLESLLDKIQQTMYKYINTSENQDYFVYGIDYNHPYNNWFYQKDIIFPLKETLFEGRNFPVMNKTEEYLTRTFGNYMEYPKKFGWGHSMYVELSEKDNDIIKNLIDMGVV